MHTDKIDFLQNIGRESHVRERKKKDYTGPSSRHTEQYNIPSKDYKINNASNIMTIIIRLINWCLFCVGGPMVWAALTGLWINFLLYYYNFLHNIISTFFAKKLSIIKKKPLSTLAGCIRWHFIHYYYFFFTFFLFLKQSGKYLSQSLYKYSKYTGLHKTGWYKNLQDFWHGWWLVHHCFVVLHWEKVGGGGNI